jgi:putative transposase
VGQFYIGGDSDEGDQRKKVVSAPVRRRQVEYAHQRGLSKRSACALMNVPRSTLGYELRQPAKDAPVISAMRRLSAQFPRFGYRRIHVYLEREGHRMGWDRAHRLWRLAGLQAPRKRPRRRIASGRPRPLPAEFQSRLAPRLGNRDLSLIRR